MTEFLSQFRKPIPKWLGTTFLIVLWSATVLGLVMAYGAWAMGMLPNMIFVMLMGAVGVLGLSRLIRFITGGLKLSDWRLPKTRRNYGPFIHMFARVGFWSMAVMIAAMAIIPIQFTEAEAKDIQGILWFCGIFAVLMSLLPKSSRRRPMTVFGLIAMIFFTIELARIYSFEAPEGAVMIASPFKGDSYVFQGGPSALVNHHYPHKNQTHALDLIILDSNGRSLGEDADIQADPCLGMPLYAPVSGEIVDVVTGVEDFPAKGPALGPITGNSLVIEKGAGVFVLLAHLQKGSQKVALGDRVVEGQEIAACGNSGNSSGPHLHLQVQTTAKFDDPDIGSLPIAFKNTARVRGDKTKARDGLTYRRNDIIRPIAR